MYDWLTIAAIMATFVIAGLVKGVIGLGLPTISLAVLAVVIDLPSAMALLLIPSFVTNLWQAVIGGKARAIIQRTWPFLVMASVTVWIGATALTRVDLAMLTLLLGVLLVAYSAVNLAGWKVRIAERHQAWAGPLAGATNGILTGMTGSFVVPGVMYLQAIGLHRDMLIQAMGMLFTLSTVALALALKGNDLLSMQQGVLSTLAVAPAIAGMVMGQAIRQRLSEQRFRRVFFYTLLALGAYIAISVLR